VPGDKMTFLKPLKKYFYESYKRILRGVVHSNSTYAHIYTVRFLNSRCFIRYARTVGSCALVRREDKRILFQNIRIYARKGLEDILECIDGETKLITSQQQYILLLKVMYGCMNDYKIIEEFDTVSKIQALVISLSGNIFIRRSFNKRGIGGRIVQCIQVLSKEIISESNSFNTYQYLQNCLLDSIVENPGIQIQLNFRRILVNVLKGFETGPRYKYKAYKIFKLRMRKFFSRIKRNAVISFITPDWIGPIVTRKSREIRVARQSRSILYENLRYSYGLLKIGSIWEWVRSYRGKVTRAFKVETFLKYYELNLESLLYRSGFVPTKNLAKVYLKTKNVCVNGKVIDSGMFRISNLDVVTFTSAARLWVKITYMKYLQSVLYSKKSGFLTFFSKFLETNYSIFGFIYLSQLFRAKDIPIMEFKFREHDRNRLVYWGKYDIGKRHRSKVVW